MKIRNEYIKSGVDQFYKNNHQTYENPHESIIHAHLYHLMRKGLLTNNSVLDLCCGTGQVSRCLKEKGFKNVEGCDPYTNLEYTKRTGFKAYNHNFLYLSNRELNRKYKYVICSFALHLCPPSLLPKVLYNLSQVAEKLIIISPHKKPEINQYWQEEFKYLNERVTTRIFKLKKF